MIVDDDPDDRELFCEAVENIGNCVCIVKSSCEEALKHLTNNSEKPHVIFLDINMPCVDGRECLERLKNDHSLQHIPVIIYSTSSNPEDIEMMLRAGADSYIAKPSSWKVLADIVSKFLEAA